MTGVFAADAGTPLPPAIGAVGRMVTIVPSCAEVTSMNGWPRVLLMPFMLYASIAR